MPVSPGVQASLLSYGLGLAALFTQHHTGHVDPCMYLAHHALKCSSTIILVRHIDHVLFLVVNGKHSGIASDILMGFACSTAPQEQTVTMLVLWCRPEPKYEVHVPSHSFVTPERTYNDVVRSYSRLYIASDFTHLLANWTQVPLSLLLLTWCLDQNHLCLYKYLSCRHLLYCTCWPTGHRYLCPFSC